MLAVDTVYRRIVSRGVRCLSILGILAIITFASSLTHSESTPPVDGLVDTPTRFVGTVRKDTALTFGGWVNFPSSQGQIQVDVLTNGDAPRDRSGSPTPSCAPVAESPN